LEVVEGRYRLLRVIGEGGAGTVWLAHDERREIEVALKILRPKLGATKVMLERFVREADLAERMLSPHIARVLARGMTGDGAPYIVYEHLDGEDLGTRLGDDGRLSIEESRAVIVHTCRALTRAHALGVLHRDIKPDNLFVTKVEGRTLVKVLDFGVAELLSTAERDGPLVGTLEYLAPEVVLGERAPSARSDIFSLGVVAYRCLSGVAPFKADNIGQLVLAHAKTTPRPLREVDERIPAELERWMVRAIARNADARFESAREMAEALDRSVTSLNVKATGVLPRFDPELAKRRESSRYAVVVPREELTASNKKPSD
jgi:eukaryotic-like serine/threonine-protein kinase